MDIYHQITEFYQSASGEKTIIGKSLLGRNLYAVKIGEGGPVGIAQYAIHGREFITAMLAIAHAERGLFRGSCWLLPLTNPDGCLLSQTGLRSVADADRRETLLRMCGKDDFSLWKANARGVDLNVNFAAAWGTGKSNVRLPGGENYIGKAPFSEPETLALKLFTEKIKPHYTVSYHTKGEEIYWYFRQPIRDCVRDKRLAMALSASTGYSLAYAKGSAGGYKDWCIQKLGISAFTIEAGADSYAHPLGEESLGNIVASNKNALYDLSKEYY